MPAPSAVRVHAFRYVVLGLLFLFSVVHFTRDAADVIDTVRHANEYVREPFQLGDWNWGAVSLQPEAEAAGMKMGDEVLAVNGRPVDGFFVYYHILRDARPGERLRVQARPAGAGNDAQRELSIVLRPLSTSGAVAGLSGYVNAAMGAVVMPTLCIALGFWVAAVRIRDRSAWLVLTVVLSLAAFVSGGGPRVLWGREHVLQPLFAAFHAFVATIAAPALMLFGITFPERLALDRRFPWVKWVVAGYLALITLLISVAVGLWVHHLAWAHVLKRPVEVLTGVEGDFAAAVSLFALIACVGSLVWKTLTAPSRDARRRLLLLDWGALAGVAALVTIIVVNRWVGGLPQWSVLPLLTLLLAFPATMAYVIVAHRVMDVRVVIRQGLQYLLARRGVLILQIGISLAIIVAAASMSAGTSVPVRIAVTSIGFALLFGIRGFAQRLRGWIDRRFFREAYEADAILTDLASRVRTMVETRTLLETVAARVAESLHVQRIAILLSERGAFRPAYAFGYAALPDVSIADDGLSVKQLQKQQHAVVELHSADSWVNLADCDERASLERLQPELLLPLSFNEKLLGILSLGPKQSEEPYSGTDIRLLDSVAAQTGLALENGRLTDAIKAEVAAREKQKRKLEIAHEVQERLFPQEYPPLAGIDYAGACRPALGVGGDYYDFILLSADQLGLAIGDVSGKGIPAALLMATLRAYLRGQTIQRSLSLSERMANLNQLVYDSSAANRYATFFYAELDAASRTVHYVNAGHNPPMVFRHGSDEVVRLEAGGPVIGLMEGCCYRQGCVTLSSGDVLVAFTDGISEAMNAADEEWGEDRLIETVRSHGAATARGLIERVMVSADAFVAGAAQHDDMTLVVVSIA